jgi:DNA-binding CsgD family transcriptional regulator
MIALDQARTEWSAEHARSFSSIVLALLDDGILVWSWSPRRVVFANALAADHLLTPDGIAVDEVRTAALEERELRTACARLHGALPARRFVVRGQAWYLRGKRLDREHDLLVCRRERLREAELVRQLQRTHGLTDRQTDVLREMLNGRRPNDIGIRLGMNVRTVYRHQADIRDVMQVKTNSAVIQRAERLRGG